VTYNINGCTIFGA